MTRVGPANCEKYNVTPPVDIIMRGCDDYRDIRLAGARVSGFQRRSDGPNQTLVEELSKDIKPVSASALADMDDDIPF